MIDLLFALKWYLVVELVALAALPLALRWLRWLPDRGYSFAKPLGILLVSYVVWLAGSLGILTNSATGIVLVTLLIALASWFWAGAEVATFWQGRRRMILGTEILFALAFAVWTLMRAYDPSVNATEKPMEIAFLSASMRTAQFPPADPWLSGFGISYYYFGYVMIALIAKLAAVPAAVAFNLAIALLFALTVAGAFSIGYNLSLSTATARAKIACGLLSSLLAAIAGNLEIVVELLNTNGLLSQAARQWVHIKDLPLAQVGSSWLPNDNWWWFRATRVVGDFDPLTNASRDYTINEFPFFSFMLGDLHPHVLALPFALLAVAVALNLLRDERGWSADSLQQRRLEWLLFGVVFGALGFLNSWDMPSYLLLLSLAFAVQLYRRNRRFDRKLITETLRFGGLLLLAALALYLPFYLSFRSQAAGFGIVDVRSKLQHFALFWGPLFLMLVAWLLGALCRQATSKTPSNGRSTNSGHLLLASAIALGSFAVLALVGAAVAGSLLAILVLGGFTFWHQIRRREEVGGDFIPLLLLTGVFLIFVCEWLFVRDSFNNRMNTVFKLYYQAWLMLAVAGGPVLYYSAVRATSQSRADLTSRGGDAMLWLTKVGRPVLRIGWGALATVTLAASLIYAFAAPSSKTEGFTARPTLDGMAFMQPDDGAAIRWLQVTVDGAPVIVEATGGSYGPAGRVAAFTGLPTLLGWEFHELQWRSRFIEGETRARKTDIDAIFSNPDRAAVRNLLSKYGATYVYVGSLERDQYNRFGAAMLEKFGSFMDVVYRNRGVTIYKTRN